MPSKPPTVCSFPGCGTLVKRGRCAEHAVKQSDRREHDPEQRRFYGSARWKRARAATLLRDPVCMTCQRRPSAQVHHRDGDWRNNDPQNLEGICRECHLKASGRDHRRKGRG